MCRRERLSIQPLEFPCGDSLWWPYLATICLRVFITIILWCESYSPLKFVKVLIPTTLSCGDFRHFHLSIPLLYLFCHLLYHSNQHDSLLLWFFHLTWSTLPTPKFFPLRYAFTNYFTSKKFYLTSVLYMGSSILFLCCVFAPSVLMVF